MRESVIYQDILRLLTRQVGTLPSPLQLRFDTLSVNELEALGEALLDFTQLIDLESWFDNQF